MPAPRRRKSITTTTDEQKRREERRARRRTDALARGEYRDGLPIALTMSPQALYHWNRNDQIDALLEARTAEPNTGFMMRLLALCTLPRTNPGRRTQYIRRNGPFTLVMSTTSTAKLPYGALPRLLLAWICTEAVRTQSRTLVLGRSLAEFMRALGVTDDSGGSRGDRTRVRNQMDRLFRCAVELTHESEHGMHRVADLITSETHLWWNRCRPNEPVLWESTIELGEKLFAEIIACPIPLDMRVLRTMKRSSLGLDLYMWLTYRLWELNAPLRLTWPQLYRQFGVNPAKTDQQTVNAFRTDVLRRLEMLKLAWPELRYATPYGCLELRPTQPRIAPLPSTKQV